MRWLRTLLIVFVVILYTDFTYAAVYKVDSSELKKLIENGTPVVDIRSQREWRQTGIIKNSILLTFFDKFGQYDLSRWFSVIRSKIGKSRSIIIICKSGGRSAAASKFLDTLNYFQSIYNANAGISGWVREKNKIIFKTE